MMTYSLLSQVTSALYLRLGQQWRRALTTLLHEKYMRGGGSQHYYRLQLAG